MTFSSNQTNFEHTFAAKVTFYKGIDSENITTKKVTIAGESDTESLIVRDASNLSTLLVSGQTTLLNLSVTGITTTNHLTINGELRDGDGDFGTAGQVLSSDGTDTKWINTSDANVGSATNVGTNEDATNADQYVTFVSAKTGNNPIRVDEGIKYNPSTNIFTAGSVKDSLGGIRNIPQVSKTSQYTLIASDTGKHISITTGGVIVPSGVFSIGDVVTIFNNSSSTQTVSAAVGVTLRQAGTTNIGTRTLLDFGLATIMCVASDVFTISGAGLI